MPKLPEQGDNSFDFFDDDNPKPGDAARPKADGSKAKFFGAGGADEAQSNIDEELHMAEVATGRVKPIRQKPREVEPRSAVRPAPSAAPKSDPSRMGSSASVANKTPPRTAATPYGLPGSPPPAGRKPLPPPPATSKGEPASPPPAGRKPLLPPPAAGDGRPAVPASGFPDPFSTPAVKTGPAPGEATLDQAKPQTSATQSDDWFSAAVNSPTQPDRAAPSGPPINDPIAKDAPESQSRRDRLNVKRRHQAQLREDRWARTRLAVPYHTDGPKITFAVIWFVAILASVLLAPIAAGLTTAFVAALAGMQTAHAWFGDSQARWWAAFGSGLIALSGLFGPLGVLGGVALSSLVMAMHMAFSGDHQRSSSELFDVLLRSTLPAGVAAGGIVALTKVELLSAVGLILLISAYEVGDFLVGSGSRTAAEGPIAGFISLGVMAFVLAMLVPEPYTPTTVIAFASIAAIGALAGQIFASAALPRGVAWAPALRRLDSYIIASPIWLLLVFLLLR